MNRFQSHRLRSLGGAVTAFSVLIAPLSVQAAYPVSDYAGQIQWVKQTATQARQLSQQAQSYAMQIRQYQNMVTNTIALPMETWATVQNDIMQVQSIANQASLLTGNSGSFINKLNQVGSFSTTVGNVPYMLNQFDYYQQSMGNNLSTMGRVLGVQEQQQRSNAALLVALQAHSASAVGQMEAMQAGNELAHQEGVQLMEIQGTLSTTAQMIATQQAVDADRMATDDAWVKTFVSVSTLPVAGNPQY